MLFNWEGSEVIMKNVKVVSTLMAAGLLLVGCGSDNGRRSNVNNNNTVEKVLEQGVKEEQDKEGSDDTKPTAETKEDKKDNENTTTPNETSKDNDKEKSGDKSEDVDMKNSPDRPVDLDLTQMGSNMVYATIYQIVSKPEDYVGQKISIKGTYSVTWYEGTGQYYHFAFIQDAAACCQQGMEFVWGDGSHVYPDEYPEQNQDIIVTGIFELYEEEGYEYMRLADATLEVL